MIDSGMGLTGNYSSSYIGLTWDDIVTIYPKWFLTGHTKNEPEI